MECSLYIKYIQSDVSFKASVSLLIFCLDYLSIDVSGVLMSPTIIVLLWISLLVSVNNYFMYLGAPVWGAYVYNCYIFFFVAPLNIM